MITVRDLALPFALMSLLACKDTPARGNAESSLKPLPATLDTTVTWRNISFHVVANGNEVTVQPSGYTKDNQAAKTTMSGRATRAEIADLDKDGWPELLVFVASNDAARRGSVVGYSSIEERAMTPIEFPGLAKDAQASSGYSGHDELGVVNGVLVQRFPVSSGGKDTGKVREVSYKLVVGEEAILRIDKISER